MTVNKKSTSKFVSRRMALAGIKFGFGDKAAEKVKKVLAPFPFIGGKKKKLKRKAAIAINMKKRGKKPKGK